MQALERKVNAPFMMPIAAKYRDLGTMIEGKIESGFIRKENKYLMMPNRETVSIAALYGETEDEIPSATCGEQVRIRLRGIEEEDVLPGFVLCSPKRPVHCVSTFEAQIVLLDIKCPGRGHFLCAFAQARKGHWQEEQESAWLCHQGHVHHCPSGSHGRRR
jgi:peptide chain release factor subunit 3